MDAAAPAPEHQSSALRTWRRTALRVRSSVRFRLLQRWNQAPLGEPIPSIAQDEDDTMGDAATALRGYDKLGVLGVGGAAVVFLVRHKSTHELYAMKVQACPMRQPWPRRTFNARKEKYMLRMLRHPFLCELHEAFHDSERLYLVLAFHHGGNLDDVRAFCGGAMQEQAVKAYASEIVQALEYVHTMGFVYRDLKPQNVLIASDGHIRLTDFGVAHEGLPVDLSRYDLPDDCTAWADELSGVAMKSSGEDATTATTAGTGSTCDDDRSLIDEDTTEPALEASDDAPESVAAEDDYEVEAKLFAGGDDRVRLRSNSFVGTVEYMPPEMIQQVSSQTTDVDWWSLGCLLYELLYGVPPFKRAEDDSTKLLFRRILVGKLTFPLFPRVSDECKSLIRGLLAVDPRQRLGHRQGSAEVKAHVFFRDVQWAYRTNETPVRVRPLCTHCVTRQYAQESQASPVFPLCDAASDSVDDQRWRRWNERSFELSNQDDGSSCSHCSERYEIVRSPSRFEAFMRSHSKRLKSFGVKRTLSASSLDGVVAKASDTSML